MSRLLRLINARHMKNARREEWERHPDLGTWASYQQDHQLTDDEVIDRAREALGAEILLTFDT